MLPVDEHSNTNFDHSKRPNTPQTATASVRYSANPSPGLPYRFVSNLRNMPKSHLPVTAPLREALIECFRAATRLVRADRRRQLVLVGGAASIAHSSEYYSDDVDVAAPSAVIIDIWKGVRAGAPNFSIDSDDKISFDAPQGFRVGLDLLEIGGGYIERIHVAEPFHEGSVASVSDLLLLRAVTVVDVGGAGEMDDFKWLLSEVAKSGQLLQGLDKEELDTLHTAVVSCLGVLGRFVIDAIVSK